MAVPAKFGSLVSGFTFAAMLACSKSPQPAPGIAPAGGSAGFTAIANAPCEMRALRIDDMNGILSAPLTATKPVSGDAQSCEFLTAGFPAITVSVRPGLGRSSVDAWMSGKMPLKVSPLAGIGDAAVWQETLHELIAQKNGLLCDIQVRGGAGDIALPAQALPEALGALCNKIFASV